MLFGFFKSKRRKPQERANWQDFGQRFAGIPSARAKKKIRKLDRKQYRSMWK